MTQSLIRISIAIKTSFFFTKNNANRYIRRYDLSNKKYRNLYKKHLVCCDIKHLNKISMFILVLFRQGIIMHKSGVLASDIDA